jgi:hypothetical protein
VDVIQYYYGGFRSKLLAILLGSGVGAIGYWIVSVIFPNAGPFNYIKNYGPAAGAGGSGNSGLRSGAPQTGAQCSQPNEDGDEFVCEAYKNGVLVTEDISK